MGTSATLPGLGFKLAVLQSRAQLVNHQTTCSYLTYQALDSCHNLYFKVILRANSLTITLHLIHKSVAWIF